MHRMVGALVSVGIVAAGLAVLANPVAWAARHATGVQRTASVFQTSSPAAGSGLRAFRSEAELRGFLKRAVRQQRVLYDMAPPPPPAVMPAAPMAAPAANQAASESSPIAVTAARAGGDTITNNQIVGVDEGGIVKARGDMLVVLRRGRLFTVSLAGGSRRAVDRTDAFAPGTDGRGDWYDEMLVADNIVAVIGYSYARGGTQVNRFRLGDDGSLSFLDAYAFRSNDYYSSRNYASRLVGKQLVLYAPLQLRDDTPLDSFPAIRRWNPATRADGVFRPLTRATDIYVPQRLFDTPTIVTTAHSVTRCDLTAPVLDCRATAVLGAESRTFFVSQNGVYVWTGLRADEGYYGDAQRHPAPEGPTALLYRLPLAAGRPQAVGVRGQPLDQFSFAPDPARGALNVVVRAEGRGDWMWNPERRGGAIALVTVPMALFGDGEREVPRGRYQQLPLGAGESWSMQNRFVGDHLLYASGAGDNSVRVVSLATRAVTLVRTAHDITRLDAIGPDAIAIGDGDGFLGFSAIDLSGRPQVASEFRLPAATEGESRSHGFFFKPDADDPQGLSGLLGLPVSRQVRWDRGFEPSAAILFLRRNARALSANGELAAKGTSRIDDACRASCVDWYGNARPIFLRGRVFALLGYELVEGRPLPGRMDEVGRVDLLSRRVAER